MLEVFTHCIENNLHEILSTFEPIQKIFAVPLDMNNITLDSIESIVQSEPDFFKEEPECLLAELQIFVHSCKNALISVTFPK